MTTIKK